MGDTLGALIGAVKIMADGGGSSQLKSLANDASLAIGNVVDCFPGQRDLESAIVRIGDIVDRLGDISSNKTAQEKASLIKESRINLQQAATKMTNASDNILSVGKGSAEEVKEGSESFVEAFKTLVATTYNFGSNVDDQISGKLTIVLQEVGYASTTLLQSTKKVAIDFENKDYRDQLHDSAKLISDAMNSLLEICSALSIGHAECNNAHQIISLTSAKFDASSSESGSNQDSYGDCLIKLTEKSKIAVGAVGALNTLARGGDMAKLSNKLVEAANVISSISEVSARAAYLVGISDPTSIPASPGPLDRHSISQCVKDVKDSCKSLIDPKNTQKEILETAGIIAKNTSILCGICKTAGQNTAVSGSSRKRCLDLAKEMADATASLATSIKQLAMSRNESCRSDCKEDCSPLVKLTEDVLNLSYSPEFAGTPAKIGVNGFALQKPIVMAQNSLLSSAESAVNIIKLVCSSPDDEDLFKQLGQSVKGVTDSLQAVAKIVIRSIPGAKETEEAISKVTESTSAIDQALVESNINNLEPTNGIEKEAVVFAIHAFTSLIDIINKVAKTDPGQLGNSLIEIPTSFHYVCLI